MNEQYQKLHRLELRIALEIKRICEKHNIAYFLTAGSLLGAVRHGGFIPWDDDMDIGMLRKDYERFLAVCQTELGEVFFLQTWDPDPEYPMSYAKIRLNGTRFVERFSEHNKGHNGIFVDIFPYDNVPDNAIDRKLQKWRYFICKRLLWIKKGMGQDMKQESAQKAIKYYVFYVASALFPYETVKNYFRKVQIKYNDRMTEKVVIDGAYSYEKDSLKREWVQNLAPIEFEKETFLSFSDRTAFLEYYYGDYMTPPPENQRGGHALLDVDFGNYL